MVKYSYNEKKHSEPYDAFNLAEFYFVIRHHEKGSELLVFKRAKVELVN